MRRIIAAIVAVLLLGSCAQSPENTGKAGKDITVDFLFEYEGCRVYRFSDAGVLRYYANCRGGFSRSQSDYWVSTGKSGYYVRSEFTVDAR